MLFAAPSLGKGVPPPDIREALRKRKWHRKLRQTPRKFVQANVRNVSGTSEAR
jgi:hypothetical protein